MTLDWIIFIIVCVIIYIASIFIMRFCLINKLKKPLDRIDLVFILVPVLNTTLLLSKLYYVIGFYGYIYCKKFKKWFLNQ